MITLPWPPKELSPNARVHWAVRHKAAKSYKSACGWQAAQAKVSIPDEGDIELLITFYPPDSRKRDDDNVIGSLKSGRDAIANIWGVDDNRFKPKYKWGPCVKGGKITVEVI